MTAELFQLLLPWLLILLAMLTGTLLEKAHFKRIHRREREFEGLPTLSTKQTPTDREVSSSALVMGDVVVSIDYFKRFLANLRNIFGGEVRSYGSLVDRGRREAVLRMKEQCPDADLIVNVRIETSSVSQGGKKQLGSVEVLAYGTAIRFATEPALENS
ncbi:MAG: heavy metal-binding domain-containing protein [Verrucomicrobiota bacterium]